MTALAVAARRALLTHDALRTANATEPPCDNEGTPLNPFEWSGWYETTYRPAYDAWSAAMDALNDAAGEQIGRHPYTFRPYCEALL